MEMKVNQTEQNRFEPTMKKIVSVSKEELQRRIEADRQSHKKLKRRGPKHLGTTTKRQG
jgi:hypothetical protein